MQSDDALNIYQAHVDALSRAMMARDFEAFAAKIQLPLLIKHVGAEQLIKTEDEMATHFHGLHATLKSQGVTDFIRIAEEATYRADDVIEGTHITHILQSGKRLVQPYPNHLRLERINGEWLETVAANAVLNPERDVLMPRVADTHCVPPLPPLDRKEQQHD